MPDTYWFHNGEQRSSLCCSFPSEVSDKAACVLSSGQQVGSDHTHKIVVKEDGTQSLIIVPAVPEDSGEWTVIAQNRAGRSSVSVVLAVQGLTAARQKMLTLSQVPAINLCSWFQPKKR